MIDGICLGGGLNEELSQNDVLRTFLTHLSSPDRYERNVLPEIPADLLSERRMTRYDVRPWHRRYNSA
ncbi:hypothetical protein Rcae01_05422 [Novipirellula caenicola]|uniref:Uncharacterized protein n=1 Tax=Novipirellula caenicola TaxID=1536901 RepID=A0ABP9W1B0_9BACT